MQDTYAGCLEGLLKSETSHLVVPPAAPTVLSQTLLMPWSL